MTSEEAEQLMNAPGAVTRNGKAATLLSFTATRGVHDPGVIVEWADGEQGIVSCSELERA